MKERQLFIVLMAMAAAFATVAAGTASATNISGEGGSALGTGTTISAESEGKVTLHPPIGDTECEAKISGKTSNPGGATETIDVSLESFTESNCNSEAVVLKPGELIIHTKDASANNNGTLTWTGTELTTTYQGFHCIFTTKETDVGTLTGSATTGGNATLDIFATIPRTGGRSGAFCGASAQWTGSFKFTAPKTLNVDGRAELQGEAPTGEVGETFPVTWRNIGASPAVIDDETNSNGEVVETLGSGCETIAASGSCTSREFKCIKKGESTLTIRDTPSVTGSVVVKCDELPLTGGPTTANVGETVTVTWKNHTESAVVIEDESISDGTVVETLGSSCGTIAATGSCASRKIKCLKKGESTVTAADTPSTEGSFVIKCD